MVEVQRGLPFDAVEVRDAGATVRMNVEQFLTLSLRSRVRMLLEQRLRFLRGDDDIDAKLALAAIYAMRRDVDA